jgi:hypothetical protein
MSIGYLSENFGLDPSSVKIFYKFFEYLYVTSVLYRNENLGTLSSNSGSINSPVFNDATAEDGVFKFSGGAGVGSRMSFSLTENLENSSFTVIMEAEILTKKDFELGDGPVNDKEVIIGNESFEIGLNGANRFYAKSTFNEQVSTVTLNKTIYGRNILIAQYDIPNLTLFWFEPETEGLLESLTIPCDIKGMSLRIGQNMHSDTRNLISGDIELGYSCFKLYNFMFLDATISRGQIIEIAKTFKGEVSEQVESVLVGQEVVGSNISENCVNITGVIGYNNNPITIERTGTRISIENTPIIGTVLSGASYKDNLCGLFSTKINLDEPREEILGYSQSVVSEQVVSTDVVNVFEPIMGLISTSCIQEETFEFEDVFEDFSTRTLAGISYQNLYPKTLSYIGAIGGDSVEVFRVENPKSGVFRTLGFHLEKGFSSTLGKIALSLPFNMQNGSGMYLYINGLYQNLGEPSQAQSIVGGLVVNTFSTTNDYSVVNGLNIVTSKVFDEENLWAIGDFMGIDQRESIEVQEFESQYLGLNLDDKWLFFNGVKLYEDVDFEKDAEHGLLLKDHVLEATGIFSTIPKNGDFIFRGLETTIKSQNFTPKSNVVFSDGLRVSDRFIVEHDADKDLIVGYSVIVDDNVIYQGMGVF